MVFIVNFIIFECILCDNLMKIVDKLWVIGDKFACKFKNNYDKLVIN